METEEIRKIEDGKYFSQNKYPIAYYEVDFKKVLKPSALLNFLQDAATINADNFGFGYNFIYPQNLGWFLIKYHFEFNNYPQDLDDILIKTEARGLAKLFAFRDFEIWTSDNKQQLGKATTSWMLIDLSSKNFVPIKKIIDFMPEHEKRDGDLSFEKIISPETFNYEKTFEIRYDDIDVNRHVNNANYVIWAFETLPYEVRSEHKLKVLDIVYKKEIAFGQKVLSQVYFDEQNNTSVHILKNSETGEDVCHLRAVWA